MLRVKNDAGEWVQAIPLAYKMLRYRCQCGEHYWTQAGYQGHYALRHVLGLKVRR